MSKQFKCLVMIVLLVCLVGNICSGATKVHEWKLDGNVNDSSGSGNNGTVTGTATYVTGVSGQAFSFDGSTKIEDTSASNLPVAAPSPHTNRQPDWSMNMYVYQDSTQPDYEIMGGFGVYSAGSNASAYPCARVNDIYLLRGHGTYYDISTSVDFPVGEWCIITITNRALPTAPAYSIWKIYKNGVLLGSKANDTTNMASQVRLGWVNNRTDENYWSGLIDEFTIWDGGC